MKRIIRAACVLALATACSQEDQTVASGQNPSDPRGSIVGVVTSLRTGAQLEGVTVSVPTAGRIVSATTDARGAYALNDLVAGASYTVRFTNPGYVPRFGDALVPNQAGDFPSNGVAQLDLALAQANATLTGHVFGRDGAPAADVVLAADLRNQGFDLVASTTTDANGAYTLTGLPGAPAGLPLTIVVQPWDANGDGVADYDALVASGATYPGATSLLDVDLRLAAPELLLLTSNVEDRRIAADAAIQLKFNQALDAGLVSASLYDATTGRLVAIVVSVDSTGKIVTVVPAPSPGTALAANHTYELDVYAVAAANGAAIDISRSFVAEVPTTVLPAVTGVAVTPADADLDTATFSLSWDASPGATGYEAWVRDTSRNPDWLRVATLGTSPAPAVSVTLPATFDAYTDDGIRTPLAFGVAVDFAVVAVNAAGALLPSAVTPIRRSDTVLPAVESAVQTGDANNDVGTAAQTITLRLRFGEYADTTVLPAIALPTGLAATPFAWDANRTTGTFTITIPAGVDGRGSYTVTGAKDTSGNAMTPFSGTLVGTTELVTDGGFESGTLGSWTTSATSTASAPVVQTAVTASGTYAAQLGSPTATQYGYSRMSRTFALPAGASSIVLSVAYRHYSGYSSDSSTCTVQDASGTYTYRTVFNTTVASSGFATATSDLTAYAGLTVRVACQTYQYGYGVSGMYLDDLSIVARL